ncbi:MAG: YitT family protein [Bacilli bacterium]
MKKIKKIKKKVNDFLFDHLPIRILLDNTKCVFFCIVAAFIFSFGYTSFVTPVDQETGLLIVTGGVSGVTQNLILLFEICGLKIDFFVASSILYAALNVPIAIFAFFFVGKKFAIYSIINVFVSSLFMQIIPNWDVTSAIRENLFIVNNDVTRVLFAGVCTGLSSAIAYKGDFSCGGIDVFTYYFALRKSTSVGKYSVAINGCIVLLHTILYCINSPAKYDNAIIAALFSIAYLFITSLIVDFINVRNKKVQIQIISSNVHMQEILVAYFPHGATVLKGKGAYSGVDKNVIMMIVSSSEVKKVVTVCQKVDDHAFLAVSPLTQVFGKFFIKPVE